MFDKIQKQLEGTARAAAICGGAAMTFAAFMVTFDVISRKLFGVTMSGADEITGYIFAVATTWAYAHCIFTRSNIRIDVGYLQFGTRGRALLDIFALGLLTIYLFLLTRSSLSVLEESWKYNYTAQTPLATPLWLPQGFWLAGLTFAFMCIGFLCIRSLTHLFRKEWAEINAISGIRSVEQDVKEETHV
jgi:TRAP-type C4-dicarboxylate transport system permease small subunit